MASWSISRLFSKVSADDFREAVTALQESLQKRGNDPLYIEIGFYRRLKEDLYRIGIDGDAGGMVKRLNAVQQFQAVGDPAGIDAGLWEEADYVEAVLKATDGSGVKAYAEAKGLQPRQITFRVSPDNPGDAVQDETIGHFRRWIRDDGVNSNRLVYGI